jgi:hypothetical protein
MCGAVPHSVCLFSIPPEYQISFFCIDSI